MPANLRAAHVDAPLPAYVLIRDDWLTADECWRLRDWVDRGGEAETARTKAGALAQVRRSTVAWVPEGAAWAWLDRRLAALLADAVRATGFLVDGFDERFQVARYEVAAAGGFDWHSDRARQGLGARRKLSISIQLSPPDDYEGGTLELFADGRPFQAPRSRGTAIVFAAFLNHRVQPVTAGVRHSLVAWAHGPDFR